MAEHESLVGLYWKVQLGYATCTYVSRHWRVMHSIWGLCSPVLTGCGCRAAPGYGTVSKKTWRIVECRAAIGLGRPPVHKEVHLPESYLDENLILERVDTRCVDCVLSETVPYIESWDSTGKKVPPNVKLVMSFAQFPTVSTSSAVFDTYKELRPGNSWKPLNHLEEFKEVSPV